jgi:hypothetical protein
VGIINLINKSFLAFGFLLFLYPHLFAQDIKYFFEKLPSFYIEDLSKQAKDSLLAGKSFYPPGNDSEEVAVYKVEELDLKKNFIRIEMSFETGQRAVLAFELRSFRNTGGNSIVVFSSVSYIPHESTQNSLVVFSYDKSKGMIPTKHLGLVTKPGITYFLKDNTPDSVIKKYRDFSSVVYELGYNGKDISLMNEGSFVVDKKDKEWFLGNMIRFVWSGDHFIRQKPIFEDL